MKGKGSGCVCGEGVVLCMFMYFCACTQIQSIALVDVTDNFYAEDTVC